MLDGIRYSLEIADRAYRRLRETIWKISSDKKSDHVDRYVDLVSDAWTIVDSLNRLRILCKSNCQYVNYDYCRAYAAELQSIVVLRNANQHMNGRLETIVADKESAWGAISWTTCITNPPTRAEVHCFVAGALRTTDLSLPEPPERPFYMPVDGITMKANKTEVFISDLMLLTAQFVSQFDADLSQLFPRDAPHVRDAHATAHISFNESGIKAPRLLVALIHKEIPPMSRAQRRRQS
ncbi:hypothetical protein [Polaromonas sp. SM01]|uniref:hypothetical protein n=1 Tax=Polaromonas sp. SM01 TaxID=3085630 RepID=UPI0029817079|nr:hypothetical protein [Polaromonas sp. SM01]MDW5442223.1 hypothetical protein [Polaromonas sp. SM01]